MSSSTCSSIKTPPLPAHGKSCDLSDTPERRRGKSRKLETDLRSSTTLQTLLHNAMQPAERRAWSAPKCRSGRIQEDVQTHITEKQRVENRHVGGSDRFQEGIRRHTTRSYLWIPKKPFGQRTVHLSTDKTIIRPACHR